MKTTRSGIVGVAITVALTLALFLTNLGPAFAVSEITTIPVGSTPYHAAVNPNTNRIYVANYGSNNVSVIDGATSSVIATIPVGNSPYDVAIDLTNNKIFVVN